MLCVLYISFISVVSQQTKYRRQNIKALLPNRHIVCGILKYYKVVHFGGTSYCNHFDFLFCFLTKSIKTSIVYVCVSNNLCGFLYLLISNPIIRIPKVEERKKNSERVCVYVCVRVCVCVCVWT